MKKVRFALIGIGGYGKVHLTTLRQLKQEGIAELSMVSILDPENHREEIVQLKKEGVGIFQNYEDMFKEGRGEIDIVSIPVGIRFHAELSIKAMESGYSVLCEKPAAATIQEVDSMIEAQKRCGVFCAIGFQHLSSRSIKKIKEKICLGKLGRIKTVSCKGRWPRTSAYYQRNDWAGKIKDRGGWVLDGSINNPFAHYINTMLYLASEERHNSANPVRVRAELYQGNKIESEDTSCSYAELDSGVKMFSFFSLSTPDSLGPIMHIEGEKATALWDCSGREGKIWITYTDGKREFLGNEGVDCLISCIPGNLYLGARKPL